MYSCMITLQCNIFYCVIQKKEERFALEKSKKKTTFGNSILFCLFLQLPMDATQQREVVSFVCKHAQFVLPRERKILPNGEIMEAPELTMEQKNEKLSLLLQKDAGIFLGSNL